jgi:hypothetical protein
MNDRQGDTGLILAKNSGQFPEISAGKHFRKTQAVFHDVKQPRPAQCMLVGNNGDVIVTSHSEPPPLRTAPIRWPNLETGAQDAI